MAINILEIPRLPIRSRAGHQSAVPINAPKPIASIVNHPRTDQPASCFIKMGAVSQISISRKKSRKLSSYLHSTRASMARSFEVPRTGSREAGRVAVGEARVRLNIPFFGDAAAKHMAYEDFDFCTIFICSFE